MYLHSVLNGLVVGSAVALSLLLVPLSYAQELRSWQSRPMISCSRKTLHSVLYLGSPILKRAHLSLSISRSTTCGTPTSNFG